MSGGPILFKTNITKNMSSASIKQIRNWCEILDVQKQRMSGGQWIVQSESPSDLSQLEFEGDCAKKIITIAI